MDEKANKKLLDSQFEDSVAAEECWLVRRFNGLDRIFKRAFISTFYSLTCM